MRLFLLSKQIAFVFLFFFLAGCSSYILNQPLQGYDEKVGYRFPKLGEEQRVNSDSLFICLAFSGGGTRAAAFSYGVLEKLRDTSIVWNGKKSSLLDEVDCISAISGGSFTAAYYGLFGDQIFSDFRSKFLDRDIQNELLLKVINPLNWPRLASPKFNRIDLATELYDETIFDHKTYADLALRKNSPYITLHATDLANGQPFEFTQTQFDLLGSDLGKFPIARAVTASSAFPFLLSPVTLKNYPRPSNFEIPKEITKGTEDYQARRRWHWANQQRKYLNKVLKPNVHLMDGGLSDNIGLRSIHNAFLRGSIREGIVTNKIQKLIIIVVNAKTDDQDSLSRDDVPPGLGDVAYKTTTIALDNYSFESIESMRDLTEQRQQLQEDRKFCNDELKACNAKKSLPPLGGDGFQPVVIDLNFEATKDPQQAEYLLNLPTSFYLPKEDIEELINAGKDLLEQSSEFNELKKELGSR